MKLPKLYASNHLIRDVKTDELLINCATDERAAEIVRRVNAHEALVEALMRAETVLVATDFFARTDHATCKTIESDTCALCRVRAALALAGEL